jgi:hypothetical protein
VARPKHRSQEEIVRRCRALEQEVRAAYERNGSAALDPGVVDALWRGEALGTLLWALRLLELPPYDTPFAAAETLATPTSEAELRPLDELELEREAARLWHWRARTSQLAAAGALELGWRYASVDQLVAATAMRGHEEGLLPAPLRGDFPAFGKIYRQLTPLERAEAHSIALERHHALNWLCGLGESWDDVPLDT